MKSCDCDLILHVIAGKDMNVRGLAAPSNLSMNQTLEGHSGKPPCAVSSSVQLHIHKHPQS